MKKKQIYEAKVTDRVDFQDKAKVCVINAPEAEDNGTMITVKHAIPGQKIEFRLKRQGKGDLVQVLERSPLETEETCSVFGRCGGCGYISMDYDAQLKMKLDMVRRLFGAEDGKIRPGFPGEILHSPLKKRYRNKMEYSFGDMEKGGKMTLGLHRRGSRYDVVNVTDCLLVHDDCNKIAAAVQDFFAEKKVPYYHKMTGEGYLRHLVLRRSEATGELLLNLVTTSSSCFYNAAEESPKTTAGMHKGGCVKSLLAAFTEKVLSIPIEGKIAGMIHTVNDSIADVVKDEGTSLLYGRDHITEDLLGLKFKITPFSFFQTNSNGAEVLYSKVREYALSGMTDTFTEKEKPVIFDLYSGTGTIAQVMAPVAKKVYGVEIVEEAVEAARINAGLNGLDNCEFIAGDVLKCIDWIEENPDFIILDPPRDGVHPKALDKILAYGVPNILYISCKPTSLVRDLQKFEEAGYTLERSCCVDMFPGTGHVETVALISSSKGDHQKS